MQESGEKVSRLFDAHQVAERVDALAAEIAAKAPENLLVIGLLKGCFVFVADLVRALSIRGVSTSVDFLTLQSYGKERTSSGAIRVLGPSPRVSERSVLLVDDIADTGRSLTFATHLLEQGGATHVFSCVLVDKPSRREVAFAPDFVGFTVGDEFVVGYGIDFAENYRQLPFIGSVR